MRNNNLQDNTPEVAYRRLQAVIFIVSLLPLLLLVIIGHSRYSQTIAAAEKTSETFSRIGQEHTSKVFEANEVILQRLLDLIGNKSDTEIATDEKSLNEAIKLLSARHPQVQSIWVLNRNGRPLLTDRFFPAPRDLDLTDRAPFRYHKAGGKGTYISDVQIGKRTREPFFEMTRARHDINGAFAGTVQISLHPSYFSNFYQEVTQKEPGLTISIMREDGVLLARWPEPPTPGFRITAASPMHEIMRSGRPTGSFTSTSTVDGVKKAAFARKLPRHNVYVYAGNSLPAAVDFWRREIWPLGLLALAFSMAIFVFGFYAVRKGREQLKVARQLQHEVERRTGAEELLRHAQKMEALGHLSGGIAHDFNNLLMVVQMNANLLMHTVLGLKGNPHLDSILRTVASGAKLTRQLLSFSRKQPLMPEVIRLESLMPEIIELCKPVLGSSISTTLKLEPRLPPVLLDSAELELSILNLAINAKHAMPNGGQFSVDVKRYSSADAQQIWAEITVSDTGSGIAPDVIGKIFEPFFTTKRSGLGTGLGLSQVQAMCQRIGGDIEARSVIGEGTTFSIRLPGSTIALINPNSATVSAETSFPRRVLFVEDNQDIAIAAINNLEHIGCQVTYCDSGVAAHDVLSKSASEFELVLSDIVMPGEMDGLELASYIRRTHPELPILLMSGYTDKLSEVEELGLPVIAKPFTIDALRKFMSLATEGTLRYPEGAHVGATDA